MNMRHAKGFTLIEVLVSMAVFAVMTILAYMSLGQTLVNAEILAHGSIQLVSRLPRHRVPFAMSSVRATRLL